MHSKPGTQQHEGVQGEGADPYSPLRAVDGAGAGHLGPVGWEERIQGPEREGFRENLRVPAQKSKV